MAELEAEAPALRRAAKALADSLARISSSLALLPVGAARAGQQPSGGGGGGGGDAATAAAITEMVLRYRESLARVCEATRDLTAAAAAAVA